MVNAHDPETPGASVGLRGLLAFLTPIMFGGIVESLNILISTLWVGRLLGESALASAANGNALIAIVTAGLFGFVTVAGILIGHQLGDDEGSNIQATFGTSLLFVLGVALLVAVTGFIYTPEILRWMELSAQDLPLAIDYTQILFAGFPVVYLAAFLMTAIRATGDSRLPFIYICMGIAVDLALHAILINGAGLVTPMGISGSAWATIGGNATTLLALLLSLSRNKSGLALHHLWHQLVRPDWASLKTVLQKGAILGLQALVTTLSLLLVLRIVNRFGVAVVAAYSATLMIWTYIQVPLLALHSAVTTLVSRGRSPKRPSQGPSITRAALLIGLGFTLCAIVISLLCAKPLLGLVLGNNIQAIVIATDFNQIGIWLYPCLTVFLVLSATVKGNGEVLAPMLMQTFSTLVVRLGVARFFADRFHERAVWWSFPIGALSAMLFMLIYYSRHRRHGFLGVSNVVRDL
jgi:putative MATE family efflux protein